MHNYRNRGDYKVIYKKETYYLEDFEDLNDFIHGLTTGEKWISKKNNIELFFRNQKIYYI
jgi:hypothetical protein